MQFLHKLFSKCYTKRVNGLSLDSMVTDVECTAKFYKTENFNFHKNSREEDVQMTHSPDASYFIPLSPSCQKHIEKYQNLESKQLDGTKFSLNDNFHFDNSFTSCDCRCLTLLCCQQLERQIFCKLITPFEFYLALYNISISVFA